MTLIRIQIVAKDKQDFQITIEPVYKTLNITEKYFYLWIEIFVKFSKNVDTFLYLAPLNLVREMDIQLRARQLASV